MSDTDPISARFEQAEDVDLDGAPQGWTPAEDVSLDPAQDAPDPNPDDPGPQPDDRGGGDDLPPELAEALSECAGFPLNDTGNGRRFVRYFGGDFIQVPRVAWFDWTGTHWRKDADQLAVRAAGQRLGDMVLREVPFMRRAPDEQALVDRKPGLIARLRALDEADPATAAERQQIEGELRKVEAANRKFYKRRDRHVSHANTTGNSARIDSALKEAGIRRAVPFDRLDAAPLDVNVQNGLLRFRLDPGDPDEGMSPTASVELVPHHRDQLCSKIAAATWDAAAACPRWEAFLARIQPDREMRAFLQRWFGLSMTGRTVQRMAFFHGSGANGKSVLIDVIANVLGNYAATARIESLTGSNRRGGGDATPDLVPLMGARMVRTSEPDEGQRLQEGLIKELTGGEPIMVRDLHTGFIEVTPVFTLTMSGNHKPDIRGTDDGIWRRLMLVPFDVQIPEAERRDFDVVVAELLAESSGILNWLADGLIDFLQGGLRPPDSITAATSEYRQDSDPMGAFLTDMCIVTGDHDLTITAKELGEAFNYYLLERGESQWKPTTISRRLKDKARTWQHPRTGAKFTDQKSSSMRYVGIRLSDTFARRFADAPRDARGVPIGVAATTPHPDQEAF